MIVTARILYLTMFVVACGCGVDVTSDDADPNESFLAGSVGGKQDAILIREGTPEAMGVLAVVNELDRAQLVNDVGLDPRAGESIEVYRLGAPGTADDRDVGTLDELDAIPWVGMSAFIALYEYAEREGYIDRFRVVVVCSQDAECGGDAICWFGRCADETQAEIHLPPGHIVTPAPAVVHTGARAGQWRLRTVRGHAATGEILGTGVQVDQASYSPTPTPFWPSMTRHNGWFVDLDIYDDRLVPEVGPDLVLPAGWRFETRAMGSGSGDYVLVKRLVMNSSVEYRVYEREASTWTLDLELTVAATSDFGHAFVALGVDANGQPLLLVEEPGVVVRYSRTANGSWLQTLAIDLVAEGFGSEAPYGLRHEGYEDGRNYVLASALVNNVDIRAIFSTIGSNVVRHDLSFRPVYMTATATGLLAWNFHEIARIGPRAVTVLETPFVYATTWLDEGPDGNITAWRKIPGEWDIEIRQLQLR